MSNPAMLTVCVLAAAIALQALPATKSPQPIVQNDEPAQIKDKGTKPEADKSVQLPTVSSSASEPNTQGKQSQATQASEPPVYSVKIIAEPSHDAWFYFSTISSTVLVFVGLGTLWVIWRQTNLTEKAADAAEKNAEALILSERSWVTVDVDPRSKIGNQVALVTHLWNTGKTPARITHTVSVLKELPSIDVLPPVPDYENTGTVENNMLAPVQGVGKEVGSYVLFLFSRALTEEDHKKIAEHKTLLYYCGCITYETFGEKKNTSFGFLYHAPKDGDPLSGLWIRGGPKSYNDNT